MKLKTTTLMLLSAIGLSGSIQAQDEETTPALTSGIKIETRTDSERVKMLLELSTVYFEEAEYTSAIAALERLLEIDPKHKQARYSISHLYISAKKYAEAEKLMQTLIDEYPEDYQVKNNLSWLYATAEDPTFRKGKEAVKLAQEAMVEAPFDYHVWSTLAEAYYTTENYEKAYRAIVHTSNLALGNTEQVSPEMEAEYALQIERFQRAWEAQKVLNSLKKNDVEEAAE